MITYFLLRLKEVRRSMGHQEHAARPWALAGGQAAGLPQRITTKVPGLGPAPRAEPPGLIKPALGTELGTS